MVGEDECSPCISFISRAGHDGLTKEQKIGDCMRDDYIAVCVDELRLTVNECFLSPENFE